MMNSFCVRYGSPNRGAALEMYDADVHRVKRFQMNQRGRVELPRRQSAGGLFTLSDAPGALAGHCGSLKKSPIFATSDSWIADNR